MTEEKVLNSELTFENFNVTVRHGSDPFIYYTEITDGSMDLGRSKKELFNYGITLVTICSLLFLCPIVFFIINMI